MTARPRRRSSHREAQLAFEALSIEGGLLSPEWLSKVAQLQAGTQAESDYRVLKGLNLRDEIGRYWRIAQAHWADFAAGRAASADSKVIAERFVIALLRDAFGFTSLVPAAPTVLQERSYPIGHASLGGRVPVVVAPAGVGLDDLLPALGDGTRRRSAFGLAQEYLNAQEAALWGIATDGASLRIVRDNASLTRPAWIEADLLRIFTEERYADFAALWLVCHETRFGRDGQPVTECALEAWRNAGREEGTRAREHLRRGVEEALMALGQGFVAHPDNGALRAALQDGTLPVKDYFNQLLRLVYRVIFLITVEERGLLHPEGVTDAAKGLYEAGYGMRRLRERSVKRSAHDRHADLWEATKIVFGGLARGEVRLGLPALAGIFAQSQCVALDGAKLANSALLLAVFKLAWLREGGSLARVNWRDMGPEELGSVYESLLELVPQIAKDGREFTFATGGETKGNARKTTGSYYTPDSLVQVLLDSALEPVVTEAIARHLANPVDALLSLAIVDPACGSGHFLLAAARRLAAHVARIQANGTPSGAEYRHALRQVVGRCIFGVDLNPMAVELCKVGLWMEAVEPGLPLTFLDSHIQHGNALLGTTPELMAKGIPDAAWDPIEGDDKKAASALKKRNKKHAVEEQSEMSFLVSPVARDSRALTQAIAELDAASDADVAGLAEKEQRWGGILGSAEYCHQKFVADAWCAAFVWPKQAGELTDAAPTNEVWRKLRDAQGKAPALTAKTVRELADGTQFFHWHLQFPQVFAKGGFDVVLGNPPWERVKLQEQEFFASRSEGIAGAANAAVRKKLIAQLPQEDPTLWGDWCAAARRAAGESQFVRHSGRYPLCGKGDVNTYALFAEHNRDALGPAGRAGFIVPTGIATDETTSAYFRALVEGRKLVALWDFWNSAQAAFFPGVGNRTLKFSLVILGSDAPVVRMGFFLQNVAELADEGRRYALTPHDIATFNPNTRTSPAFRSRRDADINLAMYGRAGIFWRDGDEVNGNPWHIRFLRMMDMANDSGLFSARVGLSAGGATLDGNVFVQRDGDSLPLVEAKMVHHFDHRFGDYADRRAGSEDSQLPDVPLERLQNPHYQPLPRYWVRRADVDARLGTEWTRSWLLGWRDITKTQNERTVIASLMPRAAVGHTTPLMMPEVDPREVACLYACLCSLPLDYAARQKVGGTHLTYAYLKQLPVLPPSTYSCAAPWQRDITLREWLVPRVLELTYTAWDVESFARDVGYCGTPFLWNDARRVRLRGELDAAFFYLYGLSRDDIDYVLETFASYDSKGNLFSGVKGKDVKAHGEYRTKRVVLEVYDALAKSVQTGSPYRTPLDPLPASIGASHGRFDPNSTPRDYAEALRVGLLVTLIRRSGDAGISHSTLSRALLWLEDAKHAAAWLQDAALADFERERESDPLLAQGTSTLSNLLQLLDGDKVITSDAKGAVRLRSGSVLPNWLPQTAALAKLATVMKRGLDQAEAGQSTTAVETVPTGKAKRA